MILEPNSALAASYLRSPILLEGVTMGEMLQQGARMPSMTFKTVDGETVTLPDDITTRYAAVLFYRGHW